MQDRSARTGTVMFGHLRFQDNDTYQSFVPEGRVQLTQTGPGLLNGRAMAYRSAAVSLLRLRVDAPAILCSELSADLVIFAFALSGNGEACVNGVPLGPCALAYLDGAAGYTTRGVRRDLTAVAFERQAFQHDLAALRGGEPQENAPLSFIEVPEPALNLIRRTALDLLSTAGTACAPAETLERRGLILRDAMLDVALLAEPNGRRGGPGLPPRDIVAWADEVCARQGSFRISVADLCRAIGVSRATLHRAFQDICGMPPSTYLCLRRMTEARFALLRSQPERGAVKRAAIDSGHLELGRFSVDYRTIFGESPRATLDRKTDPFDRP